MPENKTAAKDPSPDLVLRFLDSAVIKHLHSMIEAEGGEPFDSVRALFGEGIPLYDGSGFRHKTHIQIAVRNLACIKGVFCHLLTCDFALGDEIASKFKLTHDLLAASMCQWIGTELKAHCTRTIGSSALEMEHGAVAVSGP